MKVTNRGESGHPIHSPTGELIYGLIGRGEAEGGVESHSLAEVIIPPGRSSERHYHQELEETYYILQGQGEMEIDGKGFNLRPGDACLIEPGETHQIFNHGKGDLVFLAVCAPAWKPEDSFHT